MAGIGNLGPMGMTFNQYQNATTNTSGLAAQTTGTAKKFSSDVEETPKHGNDGVTLSDNAAKSLTDDSADIQQQQETENAQEQQESSQVDQKENKLQEKRQQNSMGHAAMSFGAKSKDFKKTTGKPSTAFYHPSQMKAPKSEGEKLSDLKQTLDDLNQAATLGILESEAKKMRAQGEAREANRHNFSDYGKNSNISKEDYQGKITELQSAELTEQRRMEIDKVMNRTPEEILGDIPPQFKATAEIMVTGQVDAVGKPKETLMQMKNEPKTEASMMELMPAESLGEIELAEQPEALAATFDTES